MHPAIQGALIGAAIGFFLYFFEYAAAQRNAKERAERLKRKPEVTEIERRRIATVLRFALVLPIGFAAAFWLIF